MLESRMSLVLEMDSAQSALIEVLSPLASLSNLGNVVCCAAYGLFALYFAWRLWRGTLPVTTLAVVFLAALAASSLWGGMALADGLLHWSHRLPSWLVPSLEPAALRPVVSASC